jgi:type II secretory pathway pseudopilin PulG
MEIMRTIDSSRRARRRQNFGPPAQNRPGDHSPVPNLLAGRHLHEPIRGPTPAIHSRPAMSKRSAFTLLELMIIVALIGNVLLVALPAFIRSRSQAQNARFVNDLRIAASAFEMYASENNKYPADAAVGVTPAGMNVYLNSFPWSSTNSIGGQWDWEPSYQSCTATIKITFQADTSDVRMADIDTRMDNGVLATGAFRKFDAKNYYYILEQ